MTKAEELAKFFHETYEKLAPRFGYKTREASAKTWGDVPEQNRGLMIAVAEKVLERLDGPDETDHRPPDLRRRRLFLAMSQIAYARHVEGPTDRVLDAFMRVSDVYGELVNSRTTVSGDCAPLSAEATVKGCLAAAEALSVPRHGEGGYVCPAMKKKD